MLTTWVIRGGTGGGTLAGVGTSHGQKLTKAGDLVFL